MNGFARRGGARPALRLYCFPYAGAGHRVFQPWRALLADDIKWASIRLPGRGARFGESRAGCQARLFAGGHFFLFEQQTELLALLEHFLSSTRKICHADI